MKEDNYKNSIKEWLSLRTRRVIDTDGLKPSAVLLLLIQEGDGVYVLVTKRSQMVSTHKGDMSLPGGGVEEQDGSIVDTALRETWEETGVDPSHVTVLGQYDDYKSIFGHHVSVIVGFLEKRTGYLFNDEIDDYVEAPLSLFDGKSYDRTDKKEFQGKHYTMYYYDLPQGTIWGLTARLLTDFGMELP
jgi:8-oxo-dGTP pyrophosphatase MutT (NUDIX family)